MVSHCKKGVNRFSRLLRILNVFDLGLKWYNVFIYPALAHPRTSTAHELEMRIEGVVCRLCAARAESAIRRLPEVETVSIDFDSQKVRVKLREPASASSFILRAQDAMDEVVLAKPARRALAAIRNIILRERTTVDNHHS